jgi:mediator of RNA polymerase II transcription subunit 31
MSSFESNSSSSGAGSDSSTIRNTSSENEMSSRSDFKIHEEEEIAIPPDDERFLVELEFVQNLSNAKYLSYLAQNKYFNDPSFMEFLRYLRYFKEPEYLRHLIFPACLPFLDALIDNPRFRQELLSPVFIEHIHAQQGRLTLPLTVIIVSYYQLLCHYCFTLQLTVSVLFHIVIDCQKCFILPLTVRTVSHCQ